MRAMGCDECDRDFAEGTAIVVAFEDQAGLQAFPLTYCPAVVDRLLLFGLFFHRDCYEVARLKEPPLPPLGAAE